MYYQNKTLTARLAAAASALNNVRHDAGLAAHFAAYNYPEERLQEARALLEAVQEAQRYAEETRTAQATAFAACRRAKQAARTPYMEQLKLARIALQDRPEVHGKLALRGARAGHFAGQMKQMEQFYRHALKDASVQDVLARYQMPAETLEAGLAAIETVWAAHNETLQRRGEAQRATARRDAAMRALDLWVSEFLKVARVTLASDPQQLEKLGLVMA